MCISSQIEKNTTKTNYKNQQSETRNTSDEIPQTQKDKNDEKMRYPANGRRIKPPIKCQMGPDNKRKEEYSLNPAKVIGKIMNFYNEKQNLKINIKLNILQTYSLRQGLHQFGQEGLKAVQKEMNQLYERNIFEPM